MAQDGYGPSRLPQQSRLQSIPAFARPSAEHVRAMQSAGALEVRLFKKFAQRPLMSVWEGEDKGKEKVLLTVLDANGTPKELARIMSAARGLHAMPAIDGVQRVRNVVDGVEGFVCDYLGAGSAADLVVLRWSAPRRLEFVCKVAEALVALHAAGIVHGCLCPDNILLNDDLRPALTEVGMVSIAESLEGDAENFFGYGAYAADAARHGTVDVEGDIYSVGRLLIFVLLDRTPADDADLAELTTKYPAVAPIVRRCTTPAGARYATMAELLAELQRCRQTLTPAPTEGEMAKRPPETKAAAPAADRLSRPGVYAPPPPKVKKGAPWWIAATSGVVALVLFGVAQVVLVGQGLVHFALQVALAITAVGVTSAIRTTSAVRVLLAIAVLMATFVVDPIGRLSRLDAADFHARAGAARAFVRGGGKDLHKKHFQRADFSGLDLQNANLTGADVTASNFAGAKLNNAQVAGASFLLANLAGADLRGVLLETAVGIGTASCDATTLLPPDWHCDAEGKLHSGAPAP